MSNQIRDVKEVVDIVEIVGEKLQLQRAGRNFKGLCPFHGEKSPSFFVSQDLQVYRCFGCGESGDVFTFLQKFDGLTFGESLKLLAERAGIKLEHTHFSKEDDQRERLFEVMQWAKDYYHFLLTKHEVGEIAREYLKDRKTFNETIKDFQLGYALPSWDGLIKYLVYKKKFSILELEAAGLVILRSQVKQKTDNPRDYYDRFRNRVVFPLTDHRGRVVGFSGRTMEKDVKEAKYINSPETVLYHKSQLLFGYSQLYRSIREAGQVIVVEGEFDVLSSVQAHVKNVVAIKGSALTKEHVARLKQAADTIVLSLDADKAGVEATKRAIEIAKPFDVRLKVLPNTSLGGKDPDDVAKDDPKKWRDHVKTAISAYQFLIDTSFAEHDPQTGEGKQNIVKELSPVLNGIPHAVERAHYVSTVAQRLNVPESVLQQDLQTFVKAKSLNYSNAQQAQPTTPQKPSSLLDAPLDFIEKHLLHILLNMAEKDVIAHARKISIESVLHPGIHRLIKELQIWSGKFSMSAFAQKIDPELQPLLTQAYLEAEPTQEKSDKEFEDTLKRHAQLVVQEKIKEYTQKLEALDRVENKTLEQEEEQNEALQQIVKLRAQTVRYD